MKHVSLLLFLFCSLLPGKPEEKPTEISLVLLGQPLKRQYTLSDDGTVGFLQRTNGEEAPSQAGYRSGKERKTLILNLNAPSDVISLKENAGPLVIQRTTESNTEGPEIATIPIRWPGRSQTAFLFKKEAKDNWLKKLAVVSLADNLASFPARSIRVLNLARTDSLCQIGEKKTKVPPGGHAVFPAPSEVIAIKIAVHMEGELLPVINTGKKLLPNDRMTIVVYPNDVFKKEDRTLDAAVVGTLFSQPAPAVSISQ